MRIVVKETYLENVTPPHRKFYRIRGEEDADGTYVLTREFGRIGKYVRCQKKRYYDFSELVTELAKQLRKRKRHGYKPVSC